MSVPHLYEPIAELPVCPQPALNFPLLTYLLRTDFWKKLSFVNLHEAANEWNPAHRLLGPKFELPS